MFCAKVKEFLSQNKIKYTERNIAADESALAELEKLGYMTTPVTVVDGEVVIGFDRAKLEKLLLVERLRGSGVRRITFAACGRPLGPWTISNATGSPSFRVLYPSPTPAPGNHPSTAYVLYAHLMSTFMAVIMSTFGKRVRQLRLRKKLSQERLAELAGLHLTVRGGIYKGKPNLSLLTSLKLLP